MSKALISEVDHTKYNISFTTDELSKSEVAHLVTEIILREYEKVVIERCVRINYDFMEPYEQAEVIKEAIEVSREEVGDGFPSFSERKQFVYEKVYEYLKDNDVIVPCGFVDFRLREIYFWAEAICAKGADIYFDKRECEEFTYLLSLFVQSKECKEETIHIIWDKGTAKLFNKRGRDVTKKYQRDFIHKAKEGNLNSDDLAISAVIAAAPLKLVMHRPVQSPLTQALSKIFGDRCSVCHGCNVCKKY